MVGSAPRCYHSPAIAELGEIDRSSTGFLPDEEHAALGRACFEQPAVSVRGWETAEHAQQRVALAVGEVLTGYGADDTVALIGHGGVGTLLLCQLTGHPISLSERPPGTDGGSYCVYDTTAHVLISGWERMTIATRWATMT